MSVSSKHYDVVVLGVGLGTLAAAALLARRSWRVLVLGQGYRSETYAYDGYPLARRPFTFLAATSPAWTRVLAELAQSQSFRRRLVSNEPMFQVLGANYRLDVSPGTDLFSREIDREFSEVRRVVDDLYTELGRVRQGADRAFAEDVVLTPGGFWERREAGRVLRDLPYLDARRDLLDDFPVTHAYRDVVTTSARFASDAVELGSPFAVARLHGAWTSGPKTLAGGEAELVEFLLERIRAQGGEVRLAERAASLVHAAGKVRGVLIDGDEAPTGATFVIGQGPSAELLDLASSFVPSRDTRTGVAVAEHRFVVNLVVASSGLPELLSTDSFIVPRGDAGRAVRLERRPSATAGVELLVCEALLSESASLDRAREDVLAVVLSELPFVERHLVLCDSPHDGRPLWDFRTKNPADPLVGDPSWNLRAELVDRARLRPTGGSVEPEPCRQRYHLLDPGIGGLVGEPIRTSLGNAFVAGATVLPPLGQEGELLAAWAVARIVTRTDRRREKMLREMWSKVELS